MKCRHKSRIGKCSNIINHDECIYDECQSQLNYQTNADRIREMSDEELAEFFKVAKADNQDCVEHREWLKWLRSESE